MDLSQVGYSSSGKTFSLVRSTAPIFGLVEAKRTSILQGNWRKNAEPQLIAELLAAHATNAAIAASLPPSSFPASIRQLTQYVENLSM